MIKTDQKRHTVNSRLQRLLVVTIWIVLGILGAGCASGQLFPTVNSIVLTSPTAIPTRTATPTPLPTPTPTPTPGACPNASDGYCRTDTETRTWIAGATNQSITSDDTTKSVTLPFNFTGYPAISTARGSASVSYSGISARGRYSPFCRRCSPTTATSPP